MIVNCKINTGQIIAIIIVLIMKNDIIDTLQFAMITLSKKILEKMWWIILNFKRPISLNLYPWSTGGKNQNFSKIDKPVQQPYIYMIRFH